MTEDDIERCLALLEAARALDPEDPRYVRLERGVAHLTKSAKKKRRRSRRSTKRTEDRARLRATGLAEARFGAAPSPPQDDLHHQRICYVCKGPYQRPHGYFHLMCEGCGDESLRRRDDPLDVTGRRALVTGGRVKIGYATALRLLRCGAEVHITTRFSADAVQRYAAEPDFSDFADRLHVYGVDFRDLRTLANVIEGWRSGPAFDIIINNAAQTVWHPPEHFVALWAKQGGPQQLSVQTHDTASQAAPLALFDVPVPSIDLNRSNSWTQRLDEIAPAEMVEVQVVNVMAPFLITSRLKDNLKRSPFAERYIINVAALEGQFDRAFKSDRHPHTNMAKAALNMLTRTSAQDLLRDGIYMVSVDPGWMSHEGPPEVQREAELRGFHPPLEAIDCAARLLDPIVRGLRGDPVQGVLLKDFRVVPW